MPDATPDAEPCIPDPDGETCNGNDDDCDGSTDEDYPGVGVACEVGVGTCHRDGLTVCTPDGDDIECGVEPGEPGTELCGTQADENCDGEIDEGFPDLADVCSVGAGACIESGIYVCSGTGLTTVCDAVPGDGSPELCNGLDDNCDGVTDEGFQVNSACDGTGDTDLCGEGVWVCDGLGGRSCTDNTGSTLDMCGNGDDDCDPQSSDGSEDSAVGQGCDGTGDTDLCIEGINLCVQGNLSCTDGSGSTVDACGGGNEDCDGQSADGSEDPMLNTQCDGAGDSDLCTEGVRQCVNEALTCSDTTGSTVDLCGNGDEDCDGGSADGSEDGQVGTNCDGSDSDLCIEGVRSCVGGSLSCSDTTDSTIDVCNNANDDCDGLSVDGSEDPGLNALCDGGGDTDLCQEGNRYCSAGVLECNDTTGSTVDACGNGNEDCDGNSVDGAEDPLLNTLCDGPGDTDLCFEGTRYCSGGGLLCNDATGSTTDQCGNGNEDCDDISADGSEHALIGTLCDGGDTDLCVEGSRVCSGTSLVCDDATSSTLDYCGNGNEDCDGNSVDGSEDPAVNAGCDGGDGDVCVEGTNSCVGGGLSCSDGTGTTNEVCANNNVDEDCDGVVDDGFSMNDNSGCWTTNLGSVSGDSGGANVTYTGYHEEWFVLRITENDSNIFGEALGVTVHLDSPAGADFDLYGYCFNCGTAVVASSSSGLAGQRDTITFRADDDTPIGGEDDSFYVLIEARYYSASYCGNYVLTIDDDTESGSNTCNP